MSSEIPSAQTPIIDLPMDTFNGLHIIKADDTSVRFNDAVKGFEMLPGERLDQAVIRAAEAAVPGMKTIIYIPPNKG